MLKKIYSVLFALTLIAITLTTSVYAWFATSKTALLDGIELGVGEDDDLWLSLDGINYHKSITNEMLVEYVGTQRKLASITSQNGKDFFLGPVLLETRAIPKVDYLSFDVYFKVVTNNPNVDAHHKYVYLADRTKPSYELASNAPGTFVASKGKNWINPLGFDDGDIYVTPGENRLYYAHNAVRIASYNESENLSFIYDVSENEARGFGKPFGAIDFYYRMLGVRMEPPEAPQNMIYKLTEFSKLQNDIAIDKTSLVSEVSLVNEVEGIYEYRGRTKISIWLEGWDADCYDAILDDPMWIQLRFKAARFDDSL